jgi:hypothetical protein
MFYIFHSRSKHAVGKMKNEKHAIKNVKFASPSHPVTLARAPASP